MKFGGIIPLAYALSLAAPSFAAEIDASAKPVQDGRHDEIALPDLGTPVGHVMKHLHRLRLRPGVDSLDVSETSRRRPRTNGE